MLSLAGGCQNAGDERSSPPAGNVAARNPANAPADPAYGATADIPSPSSARSVDPSPDRHDVTPPRAPAIAGPYLAVARSGSAVPDALGTGRFSVRNGCVVYRPDGSPDVFMPVFPARTRLLRSADGTAAALIVGGRRVEFGRSYRLSGGEVPASAAPGLPAPDRCPQRRFLLGRVTASP